MSAPEVPHGKPLVFDYSLGETLDLDAADLPRTNADGKAVIDPTAEQKYLFDTRGWLVIPAVLTADEIEEMRAFCSRLHDDPQSLPQHQRNTVAGPLEPLTDHPVIVGFMNEFLAHPRLSSQTCYGFRMEKSSLCVRRAGEGSFVAHNGNGLWRLQGDSHNYRCIPGKAQSTRV